MRYELWATQGQGGCIVNIFDTYAEAYKAFAEGLKRGDASYKITHSFSTSELNETSEFTR